MAASTRLERVRALPPAVLEELFSDDDYEQTHAVAERYGLKNEQEEALSNTLSDVFSKDVALDALSQTLAERLKVPEETAKKIAVDIAGWRLLHLKDYFGDVPGAIRSWGGDPSAFLSVRAFDENAAKVLAEEIAKKLSLTLAPDAFGKLAAMVGSRVRGVRDDSEFKEALARPLEKGGIAADAETAEKILAEVELFLKKEKEKSTAPRGEAPTTVGAAGPPLPQPPAEATTPEALRDWVIAASGLRFEGMQAKRFEEIVESRLDGSRDAAAFKEVLTRGAKVGGVGLDSLAADKVVQLAEAAAAKLSKAPVSSPQPAVSPSSIAKPSAPVSKPAPQRPAAPSKPTTPLLGATHETMAGGTPQPPPQPFPKIPNSKPAPSRGSDLPLPAESRSRFNTGSRPHSEVEVTVSGSGRLGDGTGFQIPKQPAPTAPMPATEVNESESQREGTAPKIAEDADEAEIAAAAQALLQKVPMDAAAISAKLQDTITAVLRLSGLTFPNPDIQKRFENTVSARLRDLRDATETTEMATKAVAEGGVGLSSEQIAAILPILEEHVRAFHAELQREKKREIEEWKQQEAAKSEGRKSARGLAEDASRDALMARITGKSKKAQKAAATRPTPPVLGKSPIANRKSDDMPSAISHTPSSVMRPKMQDVRFTPKLVGPVEELRGITLTDFRRLSKDPAEAAVKIRDKVDLLGQESYARRITAVTAWQESEVYQLYLEVLRESLGGGKPTKEVIAGRGAARKPTLTDAEFAAIMGLSKTLRL